MIKGLHYRCNLHDNFETPPDFPAFCNETPEKTKQESLSHALAGAAVAFANTFSSSHGGPQPVQNPAAGGSSVTLLDCLLAKQLTFA